ncbi:MAG: hypothetical protein ACK4MV_19160 [Beijerinckiaceae bacterium]
MAADELRDQVLAVLEPVTRERAQRLPASEWGELAETVQVNLGQAKALYNWSYYRTSHNDFTKRLREFEKSLFQFLRATEEIEWTLQSAGRLREQVNHEVLFYAAQFSEEAADNPRGAFERYRAARNAVATVHHDVHAAYKHIEGSLKGGRPKNVAYDFVARAALEIADKLSIPLVVSSSDVTSPSDTEFVRLVYAVLESFLPEDAPEARSETMETCAMRIRRTNAWKSR